MSARTHNFRIGLFVLIGALLFIGALFAMGLRSYFGEHETFETAVTGKVENLSVGALVKLRGVTIGKVSSIEFAGAESPGAGEEFVLVRFELPRDLDWIAKTNVQKMSDGEVARGLRARIQGQGFLGASIVSLEYVDPAMYPVEPLPWIPKHYYIPSAPSQFNRVLASLEKSLRHVEDLDLAALLAHAQTLVDSANHLVHNIDHVNFDQIGTNASALIVEFRETNRGIQRTLTDAQGAIKDAQGAIKGADVPAISRETLALEAKLSGTAMELRHVLATVDMGDLNGSLANIRNATDELIVLLHTIEERPSSVIFSKSPKPVSEMENPLKK
jgi:phospholipid/cholesterol/gamma-HCH transport system substrate-binding protein